MTPRRRTARTLLQRSQDALLASSLTHLQPNANRRQPTQPSAVSRQITVRSRAAAVSLEEKIPTAVATASTLAPEEIYGAKSGAKLADQSELSQVRRARGWRGPWTASGGMLAAIANTRP